MPSAVPLRRVNHSPTLAMIGTLTAATPQRREYDVERVELRQRVDAGEQRERGGLGDGADDDDRPRRRTGRPGVPTATPATPIVRAAAV